MVSHVFPNGRLTPHPWLTLSFRWTDFEVPKCTPTSAWVDGRHWIGSLLRRADLSHNRISRVRELGQAHPFLLELHLAHNEIQEITGISELRFLRVLDLSHNRLTSTRGLVDATTQESSSSLETLVLSHNAISNVDEVAALPRLERLDLAHNQMVYLTGLGVRGSLRMFSPGSCLTCPLPNIERRVTDCSTWICPRTKSKT